MPSPPPEPRSPNYRDIAARAGVSITSVSLALRDHPSIPSATRERIKAAARELGYRPNPLVAALMSSLRGPGRARLDANIALVSVTSARALGKVHAGALDVLAAARAHAEAYGYQLTEIPVDAVESAHKDIRRILRARNIVGLLLNDTGQLLSHLDLDWDQFSVVRIGTAEPPLRFNTVTSDHYRIMDTALATLLARGYRRIGLDLPRWAREVSDFRYEAAFYRHQHLPDGQRLVGPFFDGQPGSAHALDWARAEKLDALVTPEGKLLRAARQRGMRVPEELALAHTDVATTGMGGWAGMRQDRQTLVKAAMDLLVADCSHNRRGPPAHALSIGVPGRWVDGASVAPADSRS
jgi:LacI family transcriptional regulator